MDQAMLQNRLSQISTVWTLVSRAHGGPAEVDAHAQAALVQRYQAAVYRYLLGALGDADSADEVFQEFALRLLRGDFHRAAPERGRFRDFVRTSLINLVINFRKKHGRAVPLDNIAEPAADSSMSQSLDEEFLANWRKALLDKAWEALAALQKPDGPPYYRVVRCKSEHPDLTSAQLAEQLAAEMPSPTTFTEENLRKILQRGRELFTDLLVDEVAHSLRTSSDDDLAQELIDLGFQSYCRRALERRRKANS
jgi:RNA polymerase sigma factor (sigma-70 family)